MRTILNSLIGADHYALRTTAKFDSLLAESAMLKCLISLFQQDFLVLLAPLIMAGWLAAAAAAGCRYALG